MSVFSWWNNFLQERAGGTGRRVREQAEAEASAARFENQPYLLRARALERYEAARAAYFKGSPVELEGRPLTQRESLEWEMGKTRSAIQATMEHEIEGFVDRGVDADVARRLVRGGGGNDQGKVFQLSHDYHLLERRLAALDAAEEAGAEPAQEVDAYDVLEADVSEMSPEARAEFLSANSGGAEEIRSRLLDPSHSPVVGPKANVSGSELRGEADREGGEAEPEARAESRGIWHYKTPAEVAADQRWAEEAWAAEEAERAEAADRAAVEPKAQEAAPEVVAPASEPVQEPEAPKWEADQQHAMGQLGGVQEVADRSGWEAEPEVPGAHVEPEVPDVMEDTLQRWQTAAEALAQDPDAQLRLELQETERRRHAHKAQKEQEDAAQRQDRGQELQL